MIPIITPFMIKKVKQFIYKQRGIKTLLRKKAKKFKTQQHYINSLKLNKIIRYQLKESQEVKWTQSQLYEESKIFELKQKKYLSRVVKVFLKIHIIIFKNSTTWEVGEKEKKRFSYQIQLRGWDENLNLACGVKKRIKT